MTNLYNLSVCQFRESVSLTTRVAVFLFAIYSIVFITAQEKMIGSDTCTFIAVMKDAQVVRNAPVSQFVAYPVSQKRFLTIRGNAVSFLATRSQPQPTSPFCFLYLRPKPISESTSTTYTRTSSSTIMRGALTLRNCVTDIARLSFERLITNVASSFNAFVVSVNIGVQIETSHSGFGVPRGRAYRALRPHFIVGL